MPTRLPALPLCTIVLLSAGHGVLNAAAAQRQVEVEVAPYVGLYWPTGILGSGDGVPADAGDTVKHVPSATLGMRVTIWWPGRLGFEGSVAYAASGLWTSFPYSGVPVYPAHVLTASAKALLQVTPSDARVGLHVGGGVSLVGHGGDAYHNDTYNGPTTFFGGIASVGVAFRLTRRLSLRSDAENFVYSAHLGPCTRTGPGYGGVCDVFGEGAGKTTGSRLQNDLVLSLGFTLDLTELNRP